MKDYVRLILATDKKPKIDCLLFDTICGEHDAIVIPNNVDYTYDNHHLILTDIRCYSANFKKSINFNKIKFNNNIKLTIYSTDINGIPVYFDRKTIPITMYVNNIWKGVRQIDIDNIEKINDDNIEKICDNETTDIEELKSMIIGYKEEVEELKLEVESLKDIINAAHTSTDQLCAKLDRAIVTYNRLS